jgi:2'-5' RNA ligase
LMRVFVAFELAIPTVERLVLLQEDLAKPISDLGAKPRWTDPENLHLTLKFIGDVEQTLVFRVREALGALAQVQSSFQVSTIGTGCFPDCATPRVVWAGCGEGAHAVHSLQQTVESYLDDMGIPSEARPFRPHVTLGRIRTTRNRVDLSQVIAPYAETDFGTSTINAFSLYESQLGVKGVSYRVLARFPLGN